MKLFNNKTVQSVQPEDLVADNKEIEKFNHLFLWTIRALFVLLKGFVMEDIKEIDSKSFKCSLDELSNKYIEGKNPKKIRSLFEKTSKSTLKFIERQKEYIKEKENELKDIIDLLTRAMSGLNVDNQQFYNRIYDQSEKIEKITRLDDIKKIKLALKQEVEQIKELVAVQKESGDRRIQQLAGKVDALKNELEKTQQASLIDNLTKIYNRGAFDDFIRELVEKNTVVKKPFSLLILDIDDFKKVNDIYGHLAGDSILLSFAQKCKKFVRSDDFLARYGGEEFVILLPGASLRNSLKKAKQLCNDIAAVRYTVGENSEEQYLSITTSIGVSTYKKGDTVKSVIKRADQALYMAKLSGKNKAVTEKDIKL